MKQMTMAALLALVIGSVAGQSAFAADILGRGGLKDEAVSDGPQRSWSGLWLGAVGGWQMDMTDFSARQDFISGDGKNSSFEEAHVNGFGNGNAFGELQIGLDKQIGNKLVLSVFAGVNMDNSKFDIGASGGNKPGTMDSLNIASAEKKWGGVVGPRLGYLTSPNTMFYGAGGYAFGELDKVQSDFGGKDGKGGDAFANQDTNLRGWFGEIGIETRLKDLGDNVYLKAAGRYTNFNSMNFDGASEACDEGGKCSFSVKGDRDELAAMAGLSVKFGAPLPYLGN